MKMSNEEFFEWSMQRFEQLEDSIEFKSVDREISKIFYHAIIKIKRNYTAIHHLFNGKWENSYIEAIPLIRILAEAYFHLCYIIDQNDQELLVREYKELAELQAYKVARNLKESGTRLLPEELEFIHKEYEGKNKPKSPAHLQFINQLVEKISKNNEGVEYIYTRVYNAFSSYVHFNPATSVLYGTQKEDKFVFNQFEENELLLDELQSHTNGIIILMFKRIFDYLKIQSLKDEFDKYYVEKDKTYKF
ncbi:hypothetical protein FC682_02040 [Peribacillus simplex]|uniref:DUF5677 domain-containing protein n=1 Tax=Peribacillus simplex TaxID=1478 RepID=UPI0010BE9FDA|nr:DUF5677 domain-containing protein [Peribacillus simplex]TKH07330.1 hypothetical protein FC682_02040 [Peribacillus simplex]